MPIGSNQRACQLAKANHLKALADPAGGVIRPCLVHQAAPGRRADADGELKLVAGLQSLPRRSFGRLRFPVSYVDAVVIEKDQAYLVARLQRRRSKAMGVGLASGMDG